MPNVASVLKEEISRLSRKETRSATASLVKSNAALRGSVAAMKKELASLKAEQKRLSSALSKLAKTAGVEAPQDEFHMTSRGVRSLRKRLRLTQAEFATLVGVSTQSVFLWENRGGRLPLRGGNEAALRDVQGIDAAEAKNRLSEKRRGPKAGRKQARGRRRARR
jgi:DNA-binding transcriptional regulator YiaG